LLGIWRRLRGILLGLLVLGAALVACAYFVISFSLPDYDGEIAVDNLEAEVEIIRDKHAIAHVFAKSPHDAYFAMGYLHATDRLWQMETTRRLVQGRLSERFGPRTVPTDRLMAGSLAALSDRARAALSAYSDGVNARLIEIAETTMNFGSPEFLLFGNEIEPWTPADSIGVLKAMAFQLARGSLALEVKRGRFQLALEPERLRDLFPDKPELASRSSSPTFDNLGQRSLATPGLGNLESEEGGGSNAWAVTGEHTSNRAPLMANDPHLPLSAPSTWYPMQISWGTETRIGASLAGVPAILLGHNGVLAWGLTAAEIDALDIFVEQIDPDDPNRVLRADGWEALETRDEVIRVHGAEDVAFRRRVSSLGPLLPVDVAGLASITPPNHAPAIAWTALTSDDTSFEAIFGLASARNVTDGLRATNLHVAPTLNVILADQRSIALTAAGRVPLRRLSSKFEGRLPSPGWTDEHKWVGWLARSILPRTMNPSSGIVANANNRLTDAPFPRHLSYDWDAPYRLSRIEKLLGARETHSVESFRAMQVDTVSEMARSILPIINSGLQEIPSDRRARPNRNEALERLRAWNGEMSEHLPEPLIFSAWIEQLTKLIVADELGDLARYYAGPRPLFLERVFRDIQGSGIWCDIQTTERRETCAEIASQALENALTEISVHYGDDIDDWRWGRAHPALHSHSTLGQLGFSVLGLDIGLGPFVNIMHETGGGSYTLNRGASTRFGPEPFTNVHAAGYRAVYDLSDLDRSLFIVTTGTSGHFLSRNYRNLAPLWRTGELVAMSTKRQEITVGAQGRMTLIPRQSLDEPNRQ